MSFIHINKVCKLRYKHKRKAKNNKGRDNRCRNNNGFIALFFVLTISSFLTALVFSLSQSFSYTLTLLDRFRINDKSRSAVLYCKYKLYNDMLSNIEYVPVLGVDIAVPYGTVCRYDSYEYINPQTVKVTIVGGNSFTHIYTFILTEDLYNYLKI